MTSLTFVRRCRLKKAYSEFIRVLVNCHVVVELGLGVGGSRVQTVGRPKQLNMKRDNNSLLRQQLQVSNRDTPLFHRLDEDAHFWHLRLRANSGFGSYSYFKRCYFLLKTTSENCHNRIVKRSREGENIPLTYLENCNLYLYTYNDAIMLYSILYNVWKWNEPWCNNNNNNNKTCSASDVNVFIIATITLHTYYTTAI